MKKIRRQIINLLLGLSLLMTGILASPISSAASRLTTDAQDEMEVHFMDVGQGDAVYLRGPDGTTCLYDGGSSSVKNAGAYRILPFLKWSGTGQLDYILISHMDRDHISGVQELLEDSKKSGGIRIGHVVLPKLSAKPLPASAASTTLRSPSKN